MNLTKVVSIASLCAVFAVGAAAQGTTSTKTSSKAATKTTAAKAKTTSAGDKVTPADLPQPVTDAVMKAHPKGTITSATKMTKGSAVSYSVSGKDGAKSFKMNVNADGSMAMASAKKTSTKAAASKTPAAK